MLCDKATIEFKTRLKDDNTHNLCVDDTLEQELDKYGSNTNFSTTDESIEFIRELILENEET